MSNIVIVDSGIGGISVYRQIRKLLPKHDVIYFADNAHFPYGDKNLLDLKRIAVDNVKCVLSNYQSDIIVIACSTLTSNLLGYLADTFPQTTFVGTRPAVKQALEYTTANALVIATPLTVANLQKQNTSNLIYLALPALAGMIEDQARESQIREYVESELKKVTLPYDCVVLGCTHYILAKQLFESIFVGKKVFDGASGVAAHVKTLMKNKRATNPTPVTTVVLTNPTPAEYEKYITLIRDKNG